MLAMTQKARFCMQKGIPDTVKGMPFQGYLASTLETNGRTVICTCLLLGALYDAIGKTHQTLHFAGNDNLGGLAVGNLLHGLNGFQP